MSTMLRTENLTYSYPAGEENEQPTLALDGVTLAIERGSFTVILGHNGSGKSTLAKTFNAVLLPSGGRVYVDGMDTVDETLLLEIRRRVGMVFQNPDNQIVATIVEEDVAFAPENLGVPSEEIRRRVYATRHEQKLNTTDNSMDILNKLPRFLSKAAIRFIRWLDRHGWCPDVLIGDDPNYASVFLSNLGSIRLRSGYHHLTNWGTCSFFCVIGEKKWTPLYDQNGLVAMRETVDLGFTVDERIADGYYYSKSIRLFKHLLAHPELLELPFEQEVDYD